MVFEALRPEAELMLSSLALALVLDFLYPEHRGLLLRIHPVHTSYLLALKLGRPYSTKLRGVLVWVAVMILHVTPFTIALIVAYEVHPLVWVLVAAVTLKLSMSLRLLIDICYNAYRSFARDLDEARRWVQLIVRRDVSKLDEPRVVSAALESLAESLVDGFTSPLLYYALLGPLGALVQRIANTLDGALGYKIPEYREVGWFSARADTLINYIPARLTALMIVVLAPVAGGSVVKALSTWRTWSKATESVNAGHPMSALAGALDVKLEKPGHYMLNASSREPRPGDIRRGIKLTLTVATLYTAAITLVIAATALC